MSPVRIMEGLNPVLITWYFDPSNGDIKLDCFLEINGTNHASAVGMIFLRAGVQQAHPALLHIPEGAGRETVEDYICNESIKKEVIEKLKSARVNQNDIVRHKNGHNLKDFIGG